MSTPHQDPNKTPSKDEPSRYAPKDPESKVPMLRTLEALAEASDLACELDPIGAEMIDQILSQKKIVVPIRLEIRIATPTVPVDCVGALEVGGRPLSVPRPIDKDLPGLWWRIDDLCKIELLSQ